MALALENGLVAMCLASSLAACGVAPPEPSEVVRLRLTAANVTFDRLELVAPAGRELVIELAQQDRNFHNVEIRTADGRLVFRGQEIEAGRIDYLVSPLPADRYTFICTIHPIPPMTGSLVVR